jgi:hypothetical protein
MFVFFCHVSDDPDSYSPLLDNNAPSVEYVEDDPDSYSPLLDNNAPSVEYVESALQTSPLETTLLTEHNLTDLPGRFNNKD